MSMPRIERPKCPVDKEQAIADLLESIALEETGLSHIINAEGEKIQKAIQVSNNVKELVCVNKSVKDTINALTKFQIVLDSKLEKVLDFTCRKPKEDC